MTVRRQRGHRHLAGPLLLEDRAVPASFTAVIDPATNKVVQQFVGPGGDAIRVGLGWVWLSNLEQGNVWRLDPKRIEATTVF